MSPPKFTGYGLTGDALGYRAGAWGGQAFSIFIVEYICCAKSRSGHFGSLQQAGAFSSPCCLPFFSMLISSL